MSRRMLVPLALLAATSLAGCAGSGGPKVGAAACSWRRVPHAAPADDDLTGLSFPDRTHGWAVGGINRAVIRATSDGGMRWHAQHFGGTNGLSSVAFADDRHGWAVGVHNLLIATDDGGASWHAQNPRIAQDGNLYDVAFVNRRHGWIVGSSGTIRVTQDGGRTWTPQTVPARVDLQHVRFVDAAHGWMIANNTLVRTVNGGRTWTTSYTADAKKHEIVADESFVDARHGWISGSRDEGDANPGLLLRTTDGGRTWSRHVATNYDDVRFGAVAFVDHRRGWVAGLQGEVLYTDNGGESVSNRRSPDLGHELYAIHFADARHGWGVGQFGTIALCTAPK
jgi:photosystem II stability/assembly factor-like uncharacterized protein